MSVVIVGGNERMVCQYENICKGYGCKAKVFAKEKGTMKKKIGAPDLLILFTNTVSHKMVNCAVEEAKRKSISGRYLPDSRSLRSVSRRCRISRGLRG